MKHFTFGLLCSLAAAMTWGAGAAQADPPAAPCTALVDVEVFDGERRLGKRTVLIAGSTISSIEQGPASGAVPTSKGKPCSLVEVPEGAILTPGLVAVGSKLGVVEVGSERSEAQLSGGASSHPTFDLANSYSPRSTVVPVARLAGITSAVITPTGGLISGQAAWVRLAGETQADTVLRRGAAFSAHLPQSSVARFIDRLGAILDAAALWATSPGGVAESTLAALALSGRDLTALAPLLDGKAPLLVEAESASDIEALISFAQARRLRLVLAGGTEAWMLREELAASGTAVIVDPLQNAPSSFDRLHARADSAALLDAAGVPLLLSSGSPHFARTLRQRAGNAVRAGLGHSAALRAMTRTPAEVFGMQDLGTISTGSQADLCLWSGDPLELSTRPLALFVAGRQVPLESRQTHLLQRYRELPNPHRLPLSQPN